MSPDRIVLGAIDERTLAARAASSTRRSRHDSAIQTNKRTAEMIKYASNALLATMISFANEMGNLSAAIGDIDVVDVMQGVHAYAVPGRHCTQRNTVHAPDHVVPRSRLRLRWELSAEGHTGADRRRPHEGNMRVIEASSRPTRAAARGRFIELAERAVGGPTASDVAVLGVWRLKPDTDDVRESPAVPLVETLVARGAAVSIHDHVREAVAERHVKRRREPDRRSRVRYPACRCRRPRDGLATVSRDPAAHGPPRDAARRRPAPPARQERQPHPT